MNIHEGVDVFENIVQFLRRWTPPVMEEVLHVLRPAAVGTLFVGFIATLLKIHSTLSATNFAAPGLDLGWRLAASLMPLIISSIAALLMVSVHWIITTGLVSQRTRLLVEDWLKRPALSPDATESFKITEKQSIPAEVLKSLRRSIAHREAAAAKLAEAFEQVSRESFITEPTETGTDEISVTTEILKSRHR